jgi:GTP-binding protein
MLRFLGDSGLPFVIVLTKADKLNKTQLANRLKEVEKEMDFLPAGIQKIPVSSQNGSGIDVLTQTIQQAVKEKTSERMRIQAISFFTRDTSLRRF